MVEAPGRLQMLVANDEVSTPGRVHNYKPSDLIPVSSADEVPR